MAKKEFAQRLLLEEIDTHHIAKELMKRVINNDNYLLDKVGNVGYNINDLYDSMFFITYVTHSDVLHLPETEPNIDYFKVN